MRAFRLPTSFVVLLSFTFTLLVPGSSIQAAPAAQLVDGIIRVSVDGEPGGECGDSWDNPCDLQYALAVIAVEGCELWVKMGTYTPTASTDRSASFQLRSGVALYGGFAGTETERDQRDLTNNPTILSGEIGDPDILSDNTYHVVSGSSTDSTAVLDGFQIEAGYADGSTDFFGAGMNNLNGSPTLRNLIFSNNRAVFGGGMYNHESSPVLTNITFIGNQALYIGGMNSRLDGKRVSAYGGGIYNESSSPILTDVTFQDNRAVEYGGGMYNWDSSPELIRVTFTGNQAGYGGGIANQNSSPLLAAVTINSNEAVNYGGGMGNWNSSPVLTDTVFTGNQAGSFGGGMYNSSGSNSELINVTFTGNHTSQKGGGIYNITSSPVLTNVAFVGNSAAVDGGGMYNYTRSNPVLTGVTFVENQAGFGGGGMYNHSHSNPTLIDVAFNGNQALTGGGMVNFVSSPNLVGVAFTGNQVSDNGGGLYNLNGSSPSLENVTFSGNRAVYHGGGICNSDSSPVLTNVTLTGNQSENEGGGISNISNSSPELRNVILWGNAAPGTSEMFNLHSTPVITSSVVQGGCPDGSGCTNIITADPLLGQFGSWGGVTHTFPLLPGSSALDAGDAGSCPLIDQRGIVRPQGLGCDIGAFESRGFDLEMISGDQQVAPIHTPFPEPLVLSVTSTYTEPVDGGVVVFSSPAAGPGTAPITSTVVISRGIASQSVTANGEAGSFELAANAAGSPAPVTFTLSIEPVDTTTSLASSPNPSRVGEPVTLTAEVSAGLGIPTGGVAFMDGEAVIPGCAAQPLDEGGQAACEIAFLDVGDRSLTAVYSGGPGHNPSVSSAIVQVVKEKTLSTTVTLTSSVNPSTAGEEVILIAEVSAGEGVPTGSVAFMDGGIAVPGCESRRLDSGGRAACITASLSVGEHHITAVYSGDERYEPGASAVYVQVVEGAVVESYTYYLPVMSKQ